jgi:Protein of unknown function (DUF2959)
MRLLQVSVMATATLALTGCSLIGVKQTGNERAADSMETAAVELQAESQAIDATIATLNDLVNKPREDLKPQFAQFEFALDRLNAVVKRNERVANRVDRQGSDYFASWDKELATINYGAVREQSVSRKNQVETEFNTVNRRYRETQAVLQPLIVYLEDIRTALKNDLTAGGIASVREVTANAENNARKVQTALAQVADDLAISGARMSSVAQQTRVPREPLGSSEAPVGGSDRVEAAK